jgi:hypothetical protein
MGYFDGRSTAHVSRWRKKLGLQDLEKGLHYLDKLMEITKYDERRVLTRNEIAEEVERFVLANDLRDSEHNYILIMSTFKSSLDLDLARNILVALIEEAQEEQPHKFEEQFGPGTPEDGGHHSRQPQD